MVDLMYYDVPTGQVFCNGFGDNSRMVVKHIFGYNPAIQDQTVLDECDTNKQFWYTRINDRILYQSTFEKLKGEL